MMRVAFFLVLVSLLPVLGSCGPMTAPMAPRLDDEVQRRVDAGWEKALSPVARLDHQSLLDVFIGTGAYQLGVDKLTLLSEKRYSAGLVVMEVHFDRRTPAEDLFEVRVLDPNGKLLRQERYGREEVEKTRQDLFAHISPAEEGKKESPELVEQRVKQEARWAKIEEFFPESSEKQQKATDRGPVPARPREGN